MPEATTNTKTNATPHAVPDTRSSTLRIGGMHCASCVGRVEKALSAVPGVLRASVNLATERALVEHGNVEAASLERAVADAGYRVLPSFQSTGTGAGSAPSLVDLAREQDEDAAVGREEEQDLWRRLRVSIVFAGALFVVSHVGMFFALPRALASPWLQLALATPVQFYGAWPFLVGALRALRARSADMNTLIGIGTSAAYLFSVAATLAPRSFFSQDLAGTHSAHAPVYFETATTIVALILLGRVLEARARGRTRQAIRGLVALQPRTARRLEGGEEREVPIESLIVGDLVRVRPGERVPTDGVIEDGRSTLDESMLTGEAWPVERTSGDTVTGGTQNHTGSFLLRVARIGADTLLAQIVRLTQEAQAQKAPVERLADRVASVFVPIVVTIAVISFAAWFWLGPEPRLPHAVTAFVAVLIIACPCALGLATPAAIMVGTGRAGARGILIKGGAALERAGSIRTVVLDKTGTLTEGRPRITDMDVFGEFELLEVLRWTASAERASEHPIGEAIVETARTNDLPLEAVESFEALPGGGLTARVLGRELVIGNAGLWAERGIPLQFDDAGEPQDLVERARMLSSAAKTPVLVAVDGQPAALFAVSDALRGDAVDAVQRLRRLGLKVHLLTGDTPETGREIARRLGIDEVVAGVKPEGKAAEIRSLQRTGPVAMVGDGINDAPALAAADLGIAVASGTHIAVEAADVVLVRTDLAAIAEAIDLSRRTLRTIRQNLFWAFFFNVLGIPLAAGVFYPALGWQLNPMLASIAMSASSLIVLGNSLRLRGRQTGSRPHA